MLDAREETPRSVGSGKTRLIERLLPLMHADGLRVAVIANVLVTREDAERVAASGLIEPRLVVGVETGACPHTAIREGPSANLDAIDRLEQQHGHAFGNQHVPVDVEGAALRVPLTTSEAIARFTVEVLGMTGLTVTVEDIALARRAPLHATGHGHSDGGPWARSVRPANLAARAIALIIDGILAFIVLGEAIALIAGQEHHSHGSYRFSLA